MPDEGLIPAGEPDGNVGAARQTEKLDVHVRDAENRRTVDGQHAIALPHVLARRLRACGRRAHDGREVGRSDRADQHVEEESEDEIRGGTRKEHEAALPAGLTGVEPAAVLFSEIRIRLVGRKITLRAIVSRNRLGLEDDGLYLGRVLVHDDGGHAESLDGLPVADDIRRRCAGLDGRVLALELGKARAGGLERFLCSAELGFSSGDLVRCATVLFVEVHSMPLLSCGS